MAYRNSQRYVSFADLAVELIADKNRALAVLKQLDQTIDWNPINQLLEQFYDIGKNPEGGKAYPPLMLFKCLMLQKWFQIPSDPDLESQINPFWNCQWIKPHRIIPPSHGFAAGCPKKPWYSLIALF